MVALSESQVARETGRGFKSSLSACLLLFDKTDDSRYYDFAAARVETIISLLDDFDSDSYREFKYIRPGDEGQDGLNDSLAFSALALMAYWAHREGDTVLRDSVVDFLVNDMEPQYGGAVPADNLTHPRVAAVESNWCLYLITGEQRYLDAANTWWADFVSVTQEIDVGGETALIWDHRCPIAEPTHPSLGIQATNYALYTMISLYMLNHLGFAPATAALLEKVEATIRLLILAEYPTRIAEYIDGTGGAFEVMSAVQSPAHWLYAGIGGGGFIRQVAEAMRDGGDLDGAIFNMPAAMAIAGF
jgi:hypothetical protein